MKTKLSIIIAIALALYVVLITRCGKDDEETIIKDNVKYPEENTDLLNVVVKGDTLDFIYKAGSTLPSFQQGDIVVGQKNDGYLKEVQSINKKTDTLVLLTEQAALTDAIERGTLDITFSLVPEEQQLNPIKQETDIEDQNHNRMIQKIRSGNPQVKPMGELFEIRIPDVVIEIYDAGNQLAISMTIDTIILTKDIDIDLDLEIEDSEIVLFQLIGTSGDNVDFRGVTVNLVKSISNTEEFELIPPIPLGTIVFFIGPFPVVFTFTLEMYGGIGADLTLSIQNSISNDLSISSSNSAGAIYSEGSWEPVWDYSLDGNGSWAYSPSGSVTARAEGFLKGNLACKLYNVVGPSLYIKPYLYDEISYPPLDFEMGCGIGAGLDFKVKILSWALVEYNYTFLDYSMVLHSSSNSPPNTPTTPSGPASGYVDSTYLFSSSATDPDGDNIAIRFAWGDDDTSSWSSYRPSGSTISMTHSWSSTGLYYIRAQARDVTMGLSDWSNSHSISISVSNGWNIQRVDTAGYVGWCSAIVLDGSDRPHISYHDYGIDDLKYAYWTGSTWDIQTIDAAGDVGGYTSIALDGSDRPHISYCDDTNLSLKYAHWTGSSWDLQTVDATTNNSHWTDIAISSIGRPHISYLNWGNRDLKYAYWTGFSWSIQTVDATGSVGDFSSIVLDGSDRPHISYYDATNGNLKYAYWTGSTWDIQTIDAAGDVGSYTGIVLDGSDRPHISYCDDTNLGLKYAHWTGSSWDLQTVDATGNNIAYTSIAVEYAGKPHISYCDDTNVDLKYAYWTQ
ncbi:MAG: hypothetical protein WBB67_02785 [bacterium]